MSESVEVLEITDTSISTETLSELKDIVAAAPSLLEATTKTKRQLEDDDGGDERSAKKICAELEDIEAEESMLSETEIIDETEIAVNESKVQEDESFHDDSNVLEQNISENLVEEITDKSSEAIDDEEDAMLEEIPSQEVVEEEEIAEESFEFNGEEEDEEEEESENEASSDDDEELMARAIQKVEKPPAKFFPLENDEPIALDDTDDEEEENVRETKDYQSDSDEFSVDNNVLGDEEEVEGEEREVHEMFRYRSIRAANKPNLLMTRKIVKKSFKLLTKKRIERKKIEVKEEEVKIIKTLEESLVELPMESLKEVSKEEEPAKEKEITKVEAEPMEVTEEEEAPVPAQVELPAPTIKIPEEVEVVKPQEKEKVDVPEVTANHESSSGLLAEIKNSPLEEIFNRYVPKSSEQSSPTLDEFSEELFFCLQQNKQEIEKAAQLWNEKLHVKYKIRELMETIRRHRAVMEIETFGKLPESGSANNRPVISSKSSTTTNSEADHYDKQFRMSPESVSRLIQDVRASMLKRDEKQDDNMQANAAQGRQGQIIDVQSIINDFRQKNPQEIPRRGRRMKSSFGYDNQQTPHDFSTNGHDFNSTAKSSASSGSGYPEVSLHPVHNLYKNLANATGGPHFSGGQKSSLLQSILTKQSTKSPITGFHQNHSLPTTSTLARLLTAPERSIHGTQKHTATPPARQSSTKVHNNGEITITPIGLNNNSSRNKDFSMEDEDNSMEPPLVIDETEDFDNSGGIKNVTDLLCQGCKKNKAFFMCAGCSRQWYCSKECQEMAWDEHAEDCMI